jgi:hypothetical protein
METELTNEEKIYIIKSKIKFLNETLFNYNLDLELHETEQNVDNDEYYLNIAQFKINAEAKVEILKAKLAEVELLNQ